MEWRQTYSTGDLRLEVRGKSSIALILKRSDPQAKRSSNKG